jgi:hypothetical protein
VRPEYIKGHRVQPARSSDLKVVEISWRRLVHVVQLLRGAVEANIGFEAGNEAIKSFL